MSEEEKSKSIFRRRRFWFCIVSLAFLLIVAGIAVWKSDFYDGFMWAAKPWDKPSEVTPAFFNGVRVCTYMFPSQFGDRAIFHQMGDWSPPIEKEKIIRYLRQNSGKYSDVLSREDSKTDGCIACSLVRLGESNAKEILVNNSQSR